MMRKANKQYSNRIIRSLCILSIIVLMLLSPFGRVNASLYDSDSWVKTFPERYAKGNRSERFYAAKFLLDNMDHCFLAGSIVSYDVRLDSVIQTIDRGYWELASRFYTDREKMDSLRTIIRRWATKSSQCLKQIDFEEPDVVAVELPDSIGIDESFLRRHLDHIFSLRENDSRIKSMEFNDFCSYVLPYRAIDDYPLVSCSSELHDMFVKYLYNKDNGNISDVAARYNATLTWFRRAGGDYPFETMIGWRELFFGKFHDCVDKAYYATQILRSCGIPAIVEYNIARRFNVNRHYMTAYLDSHGCWQSFTPEAEVTANDVERNRKSLNIYREHFESCPSSPAMLKGAEEQVPPSFSCPGIEDVSSCYLQPVKLTIPICDSVPYKNHLVYLATFAPYGEGLIPITWGEVNGDSVTFANVIIDEIYFPVYCDSFRHLKPFAPPFCIVSDTFSTYRVEQLIPTFSKPVAVTLNRKYPFKPSEKKDAESTIGTMVLGSVTKDFAEADTLAVIENISTEKWMVLPLVSSPKYQFYRVQSPSHDPHIHLSEIQFFYNDIRIMDEPLAKCKWKAEYDGKVNTAPDKWPNVTLTRIAGYDYVTS